MARYLPDVRAAVRQVLNDEFVDDTNYEWKSDEIDVHIGLCLEEVSEVDPYEVKETLYITSRSGTATSTSAYHLIDATNTHFVGSDVGKSIYNTTDRTTALITAHNSTSDVTLDSNIMASDESYELWDTGCTSAKEINISSITDLLEVTHVEYLTRRTPKCLRNCNLFGDVLTIDMDATPTDTYPVFLYCNKVHSLTEYGSTLGPQAEKVLIDGAAAQTALAWINVVRTQAAAAITKIASVSTAIGKMSAEVEQSIDDLDSGREYINTISHGGRPESDYAAYARTGLANANGYLGQSQGYLRELSARLSIAGLINTYQGWANNKLVLYHAGLKRLSKFQTYKTYPKD